MKKLFVILLSFAAMQVFAQEQFYESYKTLKVTGEMRSLTVIGEDRDNTLLEVKDKDISQADYDAQIKRNKLVVDFAEPTMDFIIRVPKEVHVVIEPKDIVFEGLFEKDKDSRMIVIKNLEGSIDVTTDGYEVELVRNSNDISVVSYLDISADSIAMRKGGSISMDSYWGDVKLGSIPPLDAQISMRAKQGIVELDSLIHIVDQRILLNDNIAVIAGDGTADILLHSEKGKYVLLNMQEVEVQMINVDNEMLKIEGDMLKIEHEMQKIEDLSFSDIGFRLQQNSPNPWKKSTKIDYILPHDAAVKFRFFTNSGKTLHSETVSGKEGMNTLKVDRKLLPKVGVIFYSMSYNDIFLSMKMIHLD